MKAIKNIKIVDTDRILTGMALLYSQKIETIIPEEDLSAYHLDEVIDGNGNYLSPGFIDIHIHGCAGCDTMDASFESLNTISINVAKNGVTSFLATTITSEMDRIEKAIQNIRNVKSDVAGANILGVHLEGPFINPKFKGAHDEKYIELPQFDMIENYIDVIKVVTVAPELEGSSGFIKKCRENNIVVSMGHSGASMEEAEAAIESGAGSATHIFNAMVPLNHRNPGLIGAALLKDIYTEIIADNIHVNPNMYKILHSLKGTDRIILITDAIMGCMLEDGKYQLGGLPVNVVNGEARLEDGTLAGSTLTLNRAVNNFMQGAGIKLCEAVRLAAYNPAVLLGISDVKGQLKKGYDADITIFDENLNIKFTFVGGKIVYKS
jgi:N-acetylglucosamine-6-phosphate deacetylase